MTISFKETVLIETKVVMETNQRRSFLMQAGAGMAGVLAMAVSRPAMAEVVPS